MSLLTKAAPQQLALGQAPNSNPNAGSMTPFIRASQQKFVGGNTGVSGLGYIANANGTVPSEGYLEGVVTTVTASGGAGTTGVFAADAPWSVLANLALQDAQGNNIWSLDGYASYLASLYGAEFPFRADIDTTTYQATPATGNFTFQLFLMQRFGRDGIGCLPNDNAAAAYKWHATTNTASSVFSTSPTTVPTFALNIEAIIRANPPAQDPFGNATVTTPPVKGTSQFWSSQTANVLSGSNTIQLTRVGNIIRNHLLVFRDSGGSRANADSTGVTPTTITMQINAANRYDNISVATLRNTAYRQTGIQEPAGVVPLLYTSDPTGFALSEYGDSYLVTTSSTNIQLKFTSSAAGTLQIITNDITSPNPAGIFATAMGLY